MPTEKIQVIKLPANKKEDSSGQKAFPKMPRLYLELLENKRKIKPELVNKEYIQKNDDTSEPAQNVTQSKMSQSRHTDESRSESRHTNESRHSRRTESRHSRHTDESTRESRRESRHTDESRHSRHPDESRRESRHSDESDKDSVFNIPLVKKPYDDLSEDFESPSRPEKMYTSSRSASSLASTSRSSVSSSSHNKKDETISNRLHELLDDSEAEAVLEAEHKPTPGVRIPPSLSDLEKSGKLTISKEPQEIAQMSEEDQDDAKREYLYKFEILQKSYRNAKIPEFTIHSDFQTIKRTYENTLRMLTLDQTVDDYKRYMSIGFGAVEFVLGSVFHFDMAGYAAQQQLNMNSYERLLIELGEKSYVPTGSKYPVELRLLFVVIVNTAFFLISKIVLKKTGVNIGNSTTSQPDSAPPQPKRRMKGPVVNLDDIPDV